MKFYKIELQGTEDTVDTDLEIELSESEYAKFKQIATLLAEKSNQWSASLTITPI